jgi:prepilin-type N-terminal cleavage/methylation domain-containing protein
MRQGFTLIEVLLVLAILAVLFGIVWGVTLSLTNMEARRAQSSGQQRIARNWKQTLSDDLQSVIQDTEQLNKAEGDETIRHFGVVGTATELRIDITDYSWRTEESSELRTIFYKFDPASGLTRQERDYATLQSVESAVQIAPEIVSGTFRYYDGSSWSDQWASLDRKRAPSAVEVTFYSLPIAEAVRWRQRIPSTSEPVMNQVQVRVNIPSAAQGYFEQYQRTQAPRPLQEERPPQPPAPPPPPRPPAPPQPRPSHSLFGDD